MPTEQRNLVSDQDVETFRRDGAVCLRNLFDTQWLDLIATGIERNRAAPSEYAETLQGEHDSGGFFSDYCNWRRIPEFRTFVYQSPAAAIVARLIQSRQVIFYHEHILVKEPGSQARTPWHHDQPYYPVTGNQVCSIWLPLDPVSRESCVQFVKGSHKWGRWFVPRMFRTTLNYQAENPNEDTTLYETVPDIDGHPDDYDIAYWDLQPGDCIAFHMQTLHGAAGNASLTTSRRALATRWLGDDTRFTGRPWEISPPITGGLKPGDPMACDEFPIIWLPT